MPITPLTELFRNKGKVRPFDRANAWHTAWQVITWACLILACWRCWQVFNGRMFYLLDSDMSSEMVLAKQLWQERRLLSHNWFYSTELRVFYLQWFFTPLFLFTNGMFYVRKIGTALWLLTMLASLYYACKQAGLRNQFAAIGTLLFCPVSDEYFRILLFGLSYVPCTVLTFLGIGLVLHFTKVRSKMGGGVILVLLGVFGLLAGANGMRQLLVFYLPLLLTALVFAIRHSNHNPGATLPSLPVWDKRFLIATLVGTAGAVVGWQLNSRVLHYRYHFAGGEGVHFTNFSFESVTSLIEGWLSTFGYRPGVYITNIQMLFNAFCFLGLGVYLLAMILFLRKPSRYSKGEQVFYLLSGFALLAYTLLYLFTDMIYYSRYNIPIVILMMPVMINGLYRLPLCRVYRAAIFSVMTLLLAWCVHSYYTWVWPMNLTGSYENALNALHDAGYAEGFATFWNANVMVELSNGDFTIRTWTPGRDITTPDDLYEWLQPTVYFANTPAGRVFAFFNKDEAEYQTPSTALTDGTVVYEDDHYIAYGYESYDALKADFAN